MLIFNPKKCLQYQSIFDHSLHFKRLRVIQKHVFQNILEQVEVREIGQ